MSIITLVYDCPKSSDVLAVIQEISRLTATTECTCSAWVQYEDHMLFVLCGNQETIQAVGEIARRHHLVLADR
jgi:hypothetical protein